MSTILILLVIIGPVILFTLVKTGVGLIVPFALCVGAGMIGLVLFFWASADPNTLNDPEFAVNPVSVVAILLVLGAAYGVFLLGIVVIARWFSGEYSSVKEGHER